MLELYGHPFSSYTWKAQIALYANGTDHRLRMVDPGHPDNSAFVAAAHPAGKFPVLRDGERVVVEATSIIEYLAVHHPGDAPLIPADANEAARARMIDRVFDNYVMGNMSRVVAAFIADGDNPHPGEVAAGREGLQKAYRWLERWLGVVGLPPHVSLVTCAAAPALFYADWVLKIPADCPHLRALRAELLALEPVMLCVDAARPYRKFFPLGAPDRD